MTTVHQPRATLKGRTTAPLTEQTVLELLLHLTENSWTRKPLPRGQDLRDTWLQRAIWGLGSVFISMSGCAEPKLLAKSIPQAIQKTFYAVGEQKTFFGQQEDYLRALAILPCAKVFHGQLASYYKAILTLEIELPPNKSAVYYRTW